VPQCRTIAALRHCGTEDFGVFGSFARGSWILLSFFYHISLDFHPKLMKFSGEIVENINYPDYKFKK